VAATPHASRNANCNSLRFLASKPAAREQLVEARPGDREESIERQLAHHARARTLKRRVSRRSQSRHVEGLEAERRATLIAVPHGALACSRRQWRRPPFARGEPRDDEEEDKKRLEEAAGTESGRQLLGRENDSSNTSRQDGHIEMDE
jgi:hypothetical protein